MAVCCLVQILTSDPVSLRYKFIAYFDSVWNRFDMMVYGFLILCVILRFSLPTQHFDWARMFYALTLTMFFLRFLQTFFVDRNIGPKVIMIRRMVSGSPGSTRPVLCGAGSHIMLGLKPSTIHSFYAFSPS